MLHDDLYDLAHDLLGIYQEQEAMVDKHKVARNRGKDFLSKHSFSIEQKIKANPDQKAEYLKALSILNKDPVWIETHHETPFIREFIKTKPVGFYFDSSVHFDQSLVDTGREFAKAGILKPPSEYFFLAIPGYPFKNKEKEFSIWGKWDEENSCADLLCMHNEGAPLNINHLRLSFRDSSYVIRNLEKEGWPEIEGNEFYDAFRDWTFLLLVLLNHPFYEKSETVISAKLNQKRERAGKCPLTNYINVKISEKVKSMLGSNSDGSIRRPHWRRGHIRRYSSGKVSFVRPHMVNWQGEPIETKDYRIAA